MKERKQSSTNHPLAFLLVSSTDHVSPVTGVSPTVTLSKDGASFASCAGSVTEIGNGWYSLAGNATDRATLGTLLLHATATGADPADDRYVIVPWDPFDGNMSLTNLDAAVSTRSTYAGGDTSGTTTLLTRIPGTVQAQTGDAYARIGAAGAGLTALGDTRIANLDAAVSSRSTYAGGAVASVTAGVTVTTNNDKTGYALTVAPPTAAQVRSEMDSNSTKLANLDATISSRSTYAGGAVASVTAAVTVGTNNDKTGYALTAGEHTAIATDAQTGLTAQGYTTTRAGYLDVLNGIVAAIWAAATRTLTAFGFTVSATADPNVALIKAKTDNLPSDPASNTEVDTRLAASAYTAPDNTRIAAIKAKTDNLPASPAAVSDIPTADENADALLMRDFSAITGEAARSLLNAARTLRNKVVISAGTITVYKEDGTTVAFTETVSTDAAALPIVGVTP